MVNALNRIMCMVTSKNDGALIGQLNVYLKSITCRNNQMNCHHETKSMLLKFEGKKRETRRKRERWRGERVS